MNGERWLPVGGYEGIYEVSSEGKVSSLDRIMPTKSGPRKFRGKDIKVAYDDDGYAFIYLWNCGHSKFQYIHRLVAQAFIDNPENKPEVNHKDGDKSNNSASNLEWSTDSENTQHAYDCGLAHGHKMSNIQRKSLVAAVGVSVKCLDDGNEFESLASAEKFYGFKGIDLAIKRNGKVHGKTFIRI